MSVAELMTDLAGLGIRIESHEGRLRYSPRSAVTPDLAAKMKAHKSELMGLLQHAGKECPRCGSTDRVEIDIHRGRSSRIDCSGCGRFIQFRRWYDN